MQKKQKKTKGLLEKSSLLSVAKAGLCPCMSIYLLLKCYRCSKSNYCLFLQRHPNSKQKLHFQFEGHDLNRKRDLKFKKIQDLLSGIMSEINFFDINSAFDQQISLMSITKKITPIILKLRKKLIIQTFTIFIKAFIVVIIIDHVKSWQACIFLKSVNGYPCLH